MTEYWRTVGDEKTADCDWLIDWLHLKWSMKFDWSKYIVVSYVIMCWPSSHELIFHVDRRSHAYCVRLKCTRAGWESGGEMMSLRARFYMVRMYSSWKRWWRWVPACIDDVYGFWVPHGNGDESKKAGLLLHLKKKRRRYAPVCMRGRKKHEKKKKK